MKAVLLLEDEPRARTNIQQLIAGVDHQLVIKTFSSLRELAFWFEKAYLNPEMPDPENPDQDPRILEAIKDKASIEGYALFVLSQRLIKPVHHSLLEKINRFLVSQNLTFEKKRVGILFTAHEAEAFAHDPYMKNLYDNILFKPLDHEVAREKIKWAISAEDAVKGEGLHKEKPFNDVEMLKEITVDRITTLGIATASDRYIEPGSLGRYYCDTTSVSLRNGVFARCLKCEPHPERQGSYRATFLYFGLHGDGVGEIRSSLGRHPKRQTTKLKDSTEDGGMYSAIVLDEEPASREYLQTELPANFMNLTVSTYSNLIDFLLDLDPNQAALEAYPEIENAEAFFAPMSLFFDPKGQTFFRYEGNGSERPLGFTPKQIGNLKALILGQVDSEEHPDVLKYWRGDVPETFTFQYRDKADVRFFTLAGSVIVKEDGEIPQRRIQIRFALPEEIKSAAQKQSLIQPNVSMIIVSRKFAAKRGETFWTTVIDRMKEQNFLADGLEKPFLFAFSRDRLSDRETMTDFINFQDIFYSPFDSVYMTRKMKQFMPQLQPIDGALKYDFVDGDARSFSSQIAKVKHVSEVGLAVLYSRSMELDSFRYFVIRFPEVVQQPRLIAKNVLIEEPERGETEMLHHFVFFGLGEQYNFMLRNWLMEQYSLAKQEEERLQQQVQD